MYSIKQKGFALIPLIIAMVLMSALGVGIYTITTSSTLGELLAGKDYNAYQLAKAGLRYAALQDSSTFTGGTFCMSGGCFEIAVDNTDPTIARYTSKGSVNQGTFLAANRQLAYNMPKQTVWSGPTRPFSVGDWDINKSTGPHSVITITGGADGNLSTPGDNTVNLGKGTGPSDTAPNSYGSIWYGATSTNGSCVAGSCSFGLGLRAFFEFQFITNDNSDDSTKFADGFTFAIITALKNTKNRTGGMGSVSEGELIGYAGPGNTLDMALYPGEGLVPPKMALEFDTYPNKGLLPIGKCADENGICEYSDSDTRSIAYGATTADGVEHYNYLYDRVHTRYGSWGNYHYGVQCNNDTFGDPIVGTVKACYLLPGNICASGNRYDYSNKNHVALMFWGAKAVTETDIIGRSCTGPSVSYDDNMHGAGKGTSGGDPMNSIPGVTGVSDGYHEDTAVNWMEDTNKYSVRVEIVRPTPDTGISGSTYPYNITAWIVKTDTLTSLGIAKKSQFEDVTVPLPAGIATLTVTRTVNLSAQDHSDLSKIFFGFTESSGQATGGGQQITLANLKVFFPQTAGACSYAFTPTASPTHPVAGGSFSVAVGTSSSCYWEASSLNTWITIDPAKKYGRSNGTVIYTLSENTLYTERIGYIYVGGQTFTVTQAGLTCPAITLSPAGGDTSGSPTVLTGGTVGLNYSQTITASAGGPITSWSVATSGGTSLADLGLSFSGGVISGTGSNLHAGTATFAVTASSNCGSVTRYYRITIAGCQYAVTTHACYHTDDRIYITADVAGGTPTTVSWTITGAGTNNGTLTWETDHWGHTRNGCLSNAERSTTFGAGGNYTVTVTASGGTCSISGLNSAIVPNGACTLYNVWNNTGGTADFRVGTSGSPCRSDVSNGAQIPHELNSGESVYRYTTSGTGCSSSLQGSRTYGQAQSADTNGDCAVNYNSNNTFSDR